MLLAVSLLVASGCAPAKYYYNFDVTDPGAKNLTKPGERDGVESQQWLDDGSLQLFGGDRFKKQLFHRVQRVDHRDGHRFDFQVAGFETRRVNFTFRYVPEEHVLPVRQLGAQARADVDVYLRMLAKHSEHFARSLESP